MRWRGTDRPAAPGDGLDTAPALAVRARPCAASLPSPPRTDAWRTAAARNPASQRISAVQPDEPRVGATGCKTVGSAYVGSNPTPATTCGNGPVAGNSRLCGPFSFVPACVILSRCRPSCCAVHGRIADGRPCCQDGRYAPLGRSVRTVGVHRRLFHGRPRTGRASAVFRLDVGR